MRLRIVILAAIILSVLAFTVGTGMAEGNSPANDTASDGTAVEEAVVDDIDEYSGPVGPESMLYGLKLTLEDLGETFTYNKSEKLGKQVAHARLRIAEAKAELRKNNDDAVEKALQKYDEKTRELEVSVSGLSDNDTVLSTTQVTIVKHQWILEELRASHPGNRGLERAYNNSLGLIAKFEGKTERKLERRMANGRMVLKAKEIEEKTSVKAEIEDGATNVKVTVKFATNKTDKQAIAQETLDRLRLSKDAIGSLLEIEGEEEEGGAVSTPTPNATATPSATATPNVTATPNSTATPNTTATPNATATPNSTASATPTPNATEAPNATVTETATSNSTVTPNSTTTLSTMLVTRAPGSGTKGSWFSTIGLAAAAETQEAADKLKIKAEVKGNISKVRAEYKFSLQATDRSGIIEGIYQALQSLTADEILASMEFKVDKDQRMDKQEKMSKKEERKEENRVNKIEALNKIEQKAKGETRGSEHNREESND